MRRCTGTGTGTYDAWQFDGTNAGFTGEQDFVWTDLFDAAASAQQPTGYGVSKLAGGPFSLGSVASAILRDLWTRARAEWS